MIAERGHTLSWVARDLGFDPGYVMRVANGRTTPSEAFKKTLAAYMGLAVEDLFTSTALSYEFVERIDTRGLGS